jgi:uncharacterized membrane protein
MLDAALRILRENGLPTLLAVGLGGLLVYTTMRASEERTTYTALMIEQIADLREKVARVEVRCDR